MIVNALFTSNTLGFLLWERVTTAENLLPQHTIPLKQLFSSFSYLGVGHSLAGQDLDGVRGHIGRLDSQRTAVQRLHGRSESANRLVQRDATL